MEKIVGDPLFKVIEYLTYNEILNLYKADTKFAKWFDKKSKDVYRYLLSRDFNVENFVGNQKELYTYILDGYREDVLGELRVGNFPEVSASDFSEVLQIECEQEPNEAIARFFTDFHGNRHDAVLVAPTNFSWDAFKNYVRVDIMNLYPELLENHLGYRNGDVFTSLNGNNFLIELNTIDELPIIREEFIDIHINLVGRGISLLTCEGVLMTQEQHERWR